MDFLHDRMFLGIDVGVDANHYVIRDNQNTI
jgi:hypothetical protein